jgi:hypothetical protein
VDNDTDHSTMKNLTTTQSHPAGPVGSLAALDASPAFGNNGDGSPPPQLGSTLDHAGNCPPNRQALPPDAVVQILLEEANDDDLRVYAQVKAKAQQARMSAQVKELIEPVAAALHSALAHLHALTQDLLATPPFQEVEKSGYPTLGRKCLAIVMVLGVLALMAADFVNAMVWSLPRTQDLNKSLVIAFPLGVAPIGLKFLSDILHGRLRSAFLCSLAVVGLSAGVVFLLTFSLTYGTQGFSLTDLSQSGISSWRYLGTIQIISQMLLGITQATALALWVQRIRVPMKLRIPNPAYPPLAQAQREAQQRVFQLSRELAGLRGERAQIGTNGEACRIEFEAYCGAARKAALAEKKAEAEKQETQRALATAVAAAEAATARRRRLEALPISR